MASLDQLHDQRARRPLEAARVKAPVWPAAIDGLLGGRHRAPFRGCHYASLAFSATLRDSGIMASIGSRGDAHDTAAAATS